MGPRDDQALADLDNERDREELRRRYYGLMQELRVVLPGVQVLVGFLLTVPFAPRFAELEATETRVYGVALMSSMLSVVAFVAPTAFHRLGDRRARAERLAMAIRMSRLGLALLAVALITSMYVVGAFVFSNQVGLMLSVSAAVAMGVLWLLTPLRTLWPTDDDGVAADGDG